MGQRLQITVFMVRLRGSINAINERHSEVLNGANDRLQHLNVKKYPSAKSLAHALKCFALDTGIIQPTEKQKRISRAISRATAKFNRSRKQTAQARQAVNAFKALLATHTNWQAFTVLAQSLKRDHAFIQATTLILALIFMMLLNDNIQHKTDLSFIEPYSSVQVTQQKAPTPPPFPSIS